MLCYRVLLSLLLNYSTVPIHAEFGRIPTVNIFRYSNCNILIVVFASSYHLQFIKMNERRMSKRTVKPTARYIGWYGMRMLIASRERHYRDDTGQPASLHNQ